MDELKRLSQVQYDYLMSRLAGSLHTQRKYIKVIGVERVNAVVSRYNVKRQGEFYPYLIEETFAGIGNIYLILGGCINAKNS